MIIHIINFVYLHAGRKKREGMIGNVYLRTLVAGIAIAGIGGACGNSSCTKTGNVEGVTWDVSVHEVVNFNDSILGVGTDYEYTIADTARVNKELKNLRYCGNVSIGWTMPSSDGSIWLVAYEKEALLTEQAEVTEVTTLPSYGGDFQVAFKFPDAEEWEKITGENIGHRLALVVNGKLMSAPQVNTAISSGNCSVAIPAEMIKKYLPEFDPANMEQ